MFCKRGEGYYAKVVNKRMSWASCHLGSSDNAFNIKHKEGWDINSYLLLNQRK